MTNLKGKICIVTGASKGIGAGIARAMGEAGASVIVNYASSREGADTVVAEIEGHGGEALAVQADVSNPDSVKRLFAEAGARFGKIDILVNNAAVYLIAPLEQITPDQFHRQFDTNVLGVVLATQEAAKHFGAEGGSIVNIGSIDSRRAVPNMSLYAASKGALDALTRAHAAELAPRGIRVNTLAPGATHTEGITDAGFIGSPMEQAVIERTPLGRLSQPDDIARVAVFLASDDARWITGARIVASGGLYS